MARILVAVSGGVDSSVAAAILLAQGHEVVGAYMKNWTNEDDLPGDCPWEQDIIDARAVCDFLGIEFRILSLMEEYRQRVVEYLLSGYREGITPNPDTMCNREMKFGIFREFAADQGFDFIATGHYARRMERVDGAVDVLRGMPDKDQTYFLSLLRQEQVRPALFPIGEMTKAEVRKKATELRIPVAEKKDSQGICFIGQIRMTDFLAHYIPDQPGNIVNPEGKVLGRHRGLHLHTLGQRKGLGVPSNTFGKAYVVVAKRFESNELVVAFDEPNAPDLYATRCRVGSISAIRDPLFLKKRTLLAQPRYRAPAVSVEVEPIDETTALLSFSAPQRALVPGQVCAFYEGNCLLGGGVFEQIFS